MASIDAATRAVGAVLAEQGISVTADASVATASLVTPADGLDPMMAKAAEGWAGGPGRLAATLTADAARTATLVDSVTRQAVTAWVRALSLPSCSRCAVLAGKSYPTRDAAAFRRHPRCDCVTYPTTEARGEELVTDPLAAFAAGHVRGLSRADAEAIEAGADMSRVVDVRRDQAGLVVGSSVLVRAGRLTPAAILRASTDRAVRLELMRRYGYIT